MRMLRAADVAKKIGVSRTTLWRLERDGRFPPRRRISENVVAWSEEDIDEWLAERQILQAETPQHEK